MKINFMVGIRNGEVFSNSAEESMKFLLSGLFEVAPTDGEYVEAVKEDTQSERVKEISSLRHNTTTPSSLLYVTSSRWTI